MKKTVMCAELFPCIVLTKSTVQFHVTIRMNRRPRLNFYFTSFYVLLNYAKCQRDVNPFQVDLENLALSILEKHLKSKGNSCHVFITAITASVQCCVRISTERVLQNLIVCQFHKLSFPVIVWVA